MTTTYEPRHDRYVDEADVRGEMTRVFDVCRTCRRCVDLCASFPRLFEMIDAQVEPDAGLLTPAQQDQVVEACFQCKLCAVGCPFTPDRDDLAIDFPRLMLRAVAMRQRNGHTTLRHSATTKILGRADLIGKVAAGTASISNKVVAAPPGSLRRRALTAATGVSAVRLLPPYAKQRFSTWFTRRAKFTLEARQGRVTVYPTCVVEYQQPEIGKDLVKVYERNGIECELSDARCCGAPWLHAGDVDEFTKVAERNVTTLAAEVRAGTDIVVPQPTCSYVLKHDYRDYVGPTLRDDAELVAAHTHDAAEYLLRIHTGDDTTLDTDFPGERVGTITYHAPCHLRAQSQGFESRDLLMLTGARVDLVQQCSGIDGTWGLRSGNEDISVPVAERLGRAITESAGDTVAGDCHLANTAIVEQTGREARHPLQILARAYGISEDL